MTVNALVPPVSGARWTIDDLHDLPDDGYRYEIIDGSLLVSPPPAVRHVRVTTELRELLRDQLPGHFTIVENGGIRLGRGQTTYRVPDLTVLRSDALRTDAPTFVPADVVLVVEVLSPGSASDDLIMKRYQYGKAGIGQYWIVDPRQRTLTVLCQPSGSTDSPAGSPAGYAKEIVVCAGETWQSGLVVADSPVDITLDPASFT